MNLSRRTLSIGGNGERWRHKKRVNKTTSVYREQVSMLQRLGFDVRRALSPHPPGVGEGNCYMQWFVASNAFQREQISGALGPYPMIMDVVLRLALEYDTDHEVAIPRLTPAGVYHVSPTETAQVRLSGLLGRYVFDTTRIGGEDNPVTALLEEKLSCVVKRVVDYWAGELDEVVIAAAEDVSSSASEDVVTEVISFVTDGAQCADVMEVVAEVVADVAPIVDASALSIATAIGLVAGAIYHHVRWSITKKVCAAPFVAPATTLAVTTTFFVAPLAIVWVFRRLRKMAGQDPNTLAVAVLADKGAFVAGGVARAIRETDFIKAPLATAACVATRRVTGKNGGFGTHHQRC